MPILILALLLGGLVRAASAVELIRNGDFSAGIAEWRIGDGISPTWDPLSSGNGTVSLHPSTMGMYMGGYSGPVLSQELNVTGIGGRQVDLGFDLSADSQPPAGSAIQTRIVYLDAAGVERMATLSTSVNSSVAVAPAAPSRVTGSHIFPADAARLVRFLFFKNAYGSFSADNVSLAMNGVTVGPLPQITGLSAATAAHGDSLTITGQNFGAGNGASSVRIDGSPAGVTVNSWTDTAIGITVNSPAGSGPVEVVADGVTSANESQLDITSPYFLITGTRDRFKVLQGTEVNIPLGAVFANGYTPPAGGLTWSVTDSAGAPLPASFSPATLFGEGGTILTVDTTQIPAGEHQVRVHLSDGTSQLSGSGHLHILTVGSTSFEQCVMDQNPPYTTTCNPVTSLMANRYGRINNGVNPLVTDNEGNPLDLFTADLTVTSSNPASLMIYDPHTPWGGPEVWAIGNPAANPVDVTVHFTDGSSASLPVTVNIPQSPALSAFVSPPTVTNLHTDPIQESISGDNNLISVGSSGFLSVVEDTRDWNFPANTTYSGTFKLDLSQGPAETGTTLFTGTMNDGAGGSVQTATTLTITNDPSLAAAAGFVTSIDPGLDPYVLEHFTLEFHTAGGLQFSREVFNAHSADGGYHVDGLTPGTYSVRCVVDAFINGQQRQMVQWYPNSPDQAGAQPVDFAAGGVVGNLNFFFMAPPIPHFAIGGHISNADASPYNGDVELLDSYASVVATTTAANGDYLFPSIPEGNYTVRPAVGQGSVSVNLLGADSLANDFIVSPTALTFHGHLVMTDPGGPVMGWTGALAYLSSAPSYDIYTTGGDCTAENTATLNDCTGVRLDLANLSLSFFELTNGGDGDHRVYSNATATVKDGQNNVLFTSDNLNISMDLVYSTNTSAGAGVAALDPNTPAASSLRDEIGGPAGQVEFVFTSLSPVVQGQFGVFEFTLEVRPAASPMPAVSFANLPYVQMEDGGSQQVTVSLSAPPTRTVAVDYTTGDNTAVNGTDYTTASGTLVWQPNDPQTKTFPVPILADASPEADETYTLTLANPVNCLLAGPNPVQATISEQAPGISFSGAVTDINNQPLQGILVEQVGAAPANSTTSGQNGAFTLGNLPIATPFHLRMSGGGFASSYSALMNSNVDILGSGAFTMYLPAKLTDWGITPGTGVIRSRVVDLADAFVGGAVVTATGQQGGSYTVCYDDACTPGLTATDPATGRYMVKDVLDGDTVTVSAAKANWIFRPRTFRTHADGVSMSKIRGFDSVAAEAALRQGLQAAIDALNQ
ncbi:MAG: Calx-beta domain-containing protein, partial [Thermodesulfobacteriota bacterium]